MGLFDRLKGRAAAPPAPAPAAGDGAAAEAARQAGNAALQAGRLEEALSHYVRFATLRPDHAPAHLNCGYVLQRLGRLSDAASALRRACDLDPGSHEARFFLAKVRIEQDGLVDAEKLLAESVALKPDFVHGWLELGLVREKRQATGSALQAYRRVAELDPTLSAAWENIGRLALAERDGQAALSALERAAPSPTVLGMRAEALCALDRGDEALAIANEALRQAPSVLRLQLVRANALQRVGRLIDAADAYRDVLAQQPDEVDALAGLGSACIGLDRLDEAIARLRDAVARAPGNVVAVNNLGIALMQDGQLPEARQALREGLERSPDNATLRFALGAAELSHGDPAQGWRLYESRQMTTISGIPRWQPGQSVSGKTVLLTSEQGLGDTVHFARYVPEVQALGATVVLHVHERLKPLFDGVWPGCEVIVRVSDGARFDCYTTLMSLPLLLDRPQPLTMSRPYIRSAADRRQHWRQRIGASDRPTFGIVWSGNTAHMNDRLRSMPLDLVRQAARGANDLRFVSLQFEVRDSDQAALQAWPELLHIGAEQRDMADTAALIEVLDGVMCVDTSVAHVVGALGRPLYLLLHRYPDWRWGPAADVSPWYPSARLVRQGRDARWEPVLSRAVDLMRAAPRAVIAN